MAEYAAAVRVAGVASVELVLSTDRRVGGESAMDAADRRAIPEDAVLRQPEDGRGVRHQPLAGAAFDAVDGIGSDLSEAAPLAERRRASNLPVLAAEFGDCAARPGVVERHHLRSHAARLDVPDGGHGLVQPLCAVVAIVEHARRPVLPGGVGGGIGAARRRYSTPTRACSTPPMRLPIGWSWRARA